MRQEVVVDRPAVIAVQLYAGETRVESSTDVTVAVQRADGSEVLPAGSATTTPTGTIGRYERVLTPSQLAEVDVLTATWSVTVDGEAQTRTTTIEVIGSHYFELAELRAMAGLSDTARYPLAKLVEARQKAQDELEREVGAAFVERFGSISIDGTGNSRIRLRPYLRRMLSGSASGVAYSTEALADMTVYFSGEVVRTLGVFGLGTASRDIVLRYAHGWSTEPPSDVHDVALELARHHLLGWRSYLPDETVEADDLGQEPRSAESADRLRGQTQIDAVIKAWRKRLSSRPFASVSLI